MKNDFIFNIYKDNRTVFTFKELALIVKESNFEKLKQRINYYVKTKKILNLRRGLYAKEDYNIEELASKIYKPSYISLEYVLQKEGIIFQYNRDINVISYVSRYISVDYNIIKYRILRKEILYNTNGILRYDNGINIATPERALLDLLYLNKEYYFDSLKSINKDILFNILNIYGSKALIKRVNKLFKK